MDKSSLERLCLTTKRRLVFQIRVIGVEGAFECRSRRERWLEGGPLLQLLEGRQLSIHICLDH